MAPSQISGPPERTAPTNSSEASSARDYLTLCPEQIQPYKAIYSWVWTRFSIPTRDRAERRYLAAIAELGDGPQQTAKVSALLGADQRRTALVRQNLIDLKGLIYSPRRGYVDFTAPLFGDCIRRHHTLESLQ
jgi:hypothetical protein